MVETFQLTGNAASIFEKQKVPGIFSPLAQATLDVVSLDSDDCILDVACGTGIVARRAREWVGPGSRIVGVDINDGMINVARNLTDVHSRSCEWHVADVADLPFEDGAFSIAFCQQGIQFFQDHKTALMEIKRVLLPGGRIAITVWSKINPFTRVLADSISRLVNRDVAKRTLAPYKCKNRDTLDLLLSELGFADVSVQELKIDRVINATAASIRNEIMGLPIGPAVLENGEDVLHQIVEEVIEASSALRHESDFVIPQHTYLIQAKVQ
ncbi:MAG: class I SAM-dependent methyltransferase [Gammaproteobacteria bacterium]|nr:class I SAM-dependent methyltransferase [Gammaproteobacteria bacterium]